MLSTNPLNNKIIREYNTLEDETITLKIKKAQKAFENWKNTPIEQRSKILLSVSKILIENKSIYAEMITNEMGKIKKEALAEIEKCSWVCKYYAENSKTFLKDSEIKSDAYKSYVTYQPLGVIFAIMPWNFPFWQVFRFAAPTLMAGNTCLLKHAKNVSGCGLLLEEIFNDAGLPEHCFSTLLIPSSKCEQVIKNNKIKAITLTGSTQAGEKVAEISGKYLKKTVLELGGSDPYIILKDANLKHAVECCVISRMLNAGQSCIAAKRFIVVKEIYNAFLDLFLQKMQSIKFGNPNNEKNDIGPLATFKMRDDLHKQVLTSIKKGARCILGGKIPELEGAFYPPTILVDVKKGMPAYEDELFGPVASIIKAKNEDEAIKIANSTLFGLGGAIFTQDINKAQKLAKLNIDAGCVAVNDYVKSDPRLPFGGINKSGYGRELSSNGIREFVNIKTITVYK